jgi:hypothetical protein
MAKSLPPPGPHPRRRPRRPNLFTERDLARAVRAARRAGGNVRIEVRPGVISLIPGESPEDNADRNPWDEALTDAAHKKRSP